MKKTHWSLGVAIAAVAVAGMLVPASSDACMREKFFKPQTKTDVQKVRDAEHVLAKGDNRRALKRAKQAFPRLVQVSNAEKPKATFDRAQRTAALATVRLEGDVNLGRGMRGKTAFEKQVNFAWAVAVLQYQAARNPDNLVIRAEYAEALSHTPGQSDDAYDLLNEMANEDLMPTARGYALLASLQQGMGDAVGRDLSITRCRELGADEPLCTVA